MAIENVSIADNGHLIIVLEDGTVRDAGNVRGVPGPQGEKGVGVKGDKGEPGPAGTPLLNQTLILNTVAPTALYTNQDVPQWSASYTAIGGQLLVKAEITAWSSSGGTKNWYLKKNGTIVATGSFYFNTANEHTTLPAIQYVDTTESSSAATWSISLGNTLNVDTNDRCTITVTEYTGVAGLQGIKGDTGATGPAGVGIKGFASGYVDAGQFVTLDNLKFGVTTGGNRGLCCATVSGTVALSIAGNYILSNSSVGGCSTGWPQPVYNTTASGSWFGWHFPNAGDGSTYLVNDTVNQRAYRVTLMIGYGYSKNFISIERLA